MTPREFTEQEANRNAHNGRVALLEEAPYQRLDREKTTALVTLTKVLGLTEPLPQ